MSEFKTCFTRIREINPHNNADALEIATVYGFQVVVRKGSFHQGDFVLYIPIDSVIPVDLESIIFGPDSKIKLDKQRVKQIRIRKFASQGMLISPSDIHKLLEQRGLKSRMDFKLEHDYKELLGIIKYEPPVPEFQRIQGDKKTRNKPLENPLFHKYNGLDNVKWFPDLFKPDEDVVIQEKLHGSAARICLLPTTTPSFRHIKDVFLTIKDSPDKVAVLRQTFGLIKRYVAGKLKLLPRYEYGYGSNNVELTHRVGYKGFYGEDIYGATFKRVDAFNKIQHDEIVFGEIIGEGIQKNYHYGHKQHHFVVYDVKRLNEDGTFTWLPPEDVENYAKSRGFDFVPVLYKGKFNKELAYELTKGNSVYCPEQKIREGIVIKSVNYNDPSMSSCKRALKWISEEYLDKDNTDFH